MQIRETTLLVMFILMAIGRHFIQGIATEPWMFYMGPIVDMIGGYSNSVARALISKCVGLNDLGNL